MPEKTHTDSCMAESVASDLVWRVSDGSYLGGFACEYAGNGSVEEAKTNLHEAYGKDTVAAGRTMVEI